MVAGAGVSMGMPATISAAVNAVPGAVGKAAGATARCASSAACSGSRSPSRCSRAGGYAQFSDGFSRAMLVAAGLSLAGALTGYALPRRRSAARSAALAESSIAA